LAKAQLRANLTKYFSQLLLILIYLTMSNDVKGAAKEGVTRGVASDASSRSQKVFDRGNTFL